MPAVRQEQIRKRRIRISSGMFCDELPRLISTFLTLTMAGTTVMRAIGGT